MRACKTIVAMGKQEVLHIQCVTVALGVQHAMHMCQTVICGQSSTIIVFHI